MTVVEQRLESTFQIFKDLTLQSNVGIGNYKVSTRLASDSSSVTYYLVEIVMIVKKQKLLLAPSHLGKTETVISPIPVSK